MHAPTQCERGGTQQKEQSMHVCAVRCGGRVGVGRPEFLVERSITTSLRLASLKTGMRV